ncbi:MAG TPA: nuclear transport factor 2 family protein [Candidatus Limnocylindrales bacterium]|jgi:ketosteroid isomerase-like protein|nr:nuclear transport factor 2 family protein [Candidatus Limnocylindrales bacterium]
MSIEQNATLVRRYFEECVNRVNGPDSQRALAVVDELMTDDFVMFYNNDTEEQAACGRVSHKEFLVEHARAYPDDHWTIEALVADAEVVACQWRIRSPGRPRTSTCARRTSSASATDDWPSCADSSTSGASAGKHGRMPPAAEPEPR